MQHAALIANDVLDWLRKLHTTGGTYFYVKLFSDGSGQLLRDDDVWCEWKDLDEACQRLKEQVEKQNKPPPVTPLYDEKVD